MARFRDGIQTARERALRNAMTDAEKCLWHQLRAHRFLGLSVRRQAPIGPYIVDFLIPAQKLVIEADGAQYPENANDTPRDAYLASRGYRVLRFCKNDILCNLPAVLQRIAEEIRP
ncbi:DUF559 domain-containing protein [Mesobacterium sp. TK19101]|uniref:DUF559 domain-containing protein n=1 Tax=Mesobacterium hydrothermale TaxID=3111907 RepID=A0ABU6HJE2_9RHOB|nr:DUF559 domain-containing protein [Mesobacterium sp. TK19101]MEC3862578.1 DUF559 domain-containing protein [Mesobacterium sp. TK19101]